jgi:hypothetical protein
MDKRTQFPARTPTVMATNEDRAVYSAIKAELAGNDKAIITPGFLRFDQVLGTQNRVEFPVLVNDGDQRTSEQRLRISDAFYVTGMSVFVTKQVIAQPDGSGQPETWANPLVFTGVDLPAIETIMNTGRLRVEVDSVVYLQAVDLLRFRQVGTAQQGLNVLAGNAYGASTWDTYTCFQTVTPVFRLNGGSSNVVSILLGESVAAVAPVVTDENVLTVMFHGWLAQNAGAFNPANR